MCSKAGFEVHDQTLLLDDPELPICEMTDSFVVGLRLAFSWGRSCVLIPWAAGLSPLPYPSGGRLPSRMRMILGFTCPLQPCDVGSDFW